MIDYNINATLVYDGRGSPKIPWQLLLQNPEIGDADEETKWAYDRIESPDGIGRVLA